jgi:hypothetical protein
VRTFREKKRARWAGVGLTAMTVVSVGVLLCLMAVPVLAAVGLAKPKDLPTVINDLRNWLVGLLAALATLALTYGGLRMLLAGGDPGEVSKAKDAFKAAAIGYGMAALAPVLVTVLKKIVGA